VSSKAMSLKARIRNLAKQKGVLSNFQKNIEGVGLPVIYNDLQRFTTIYNDLQ
jgi:hypothetical protein